MDETVMGEVLHKDTAAIVLRFILAVLCMFGTAPAAQQEAELFEKAYEYYLSYNPEKAVETFDLFIRQFPESSALDSAMFWRAKSFVHLKKYDEAARGLQTMKERYPESAYVVYAEKELESLRKITRISEPHHGAQDLPVKPIDTKAASVEEKIRNLERENHDLAMKLSDAERKRELIDKGLAKALEDKNTLMTELETIKKSREGLVNKFSDAEKREKDYAGLSEEKKNLETRLRESEEKIKALQTERERNVEERAILKNDLSGKIQDSRKDREQLDEYVKQLAAENAALQQSIRRKEMEMSESQQRLASLEKKAADTEAARRKEMESANTDLVQRSAEKSSLEKELSQEKKRRDELESQGRQKEDALRQLQASEERRKQYEQEMTRLTAERDALLTKAAEREQAEREKKDLLSRIESVTKDRDELAKQAALQDKTAQDKRQVETEAQRLRAETDVLQKKVKELESAEKGRNNLQAEIRERDQKLATAAEAAAQVERSARENEKLTTRNLQALKSLEAEKKDLAAKLEDQQRKNKEAEGLIETLRSEKTAYEKTRHEGAKLAEEKRVLEARLKELEEKQKSLTAEQERHKNTEGEMQGLLARLQEQERRLRDSENVAKQLGAEKQTLEGQLKERDQKLAKASETIASLQGAAQSLEQEKGKTLTDLQEKQKRAEADKIAREEELKKEQRNIAARLEDQEKKRKEQEATINKITTEKAGLEKEILSNREKLAELKTVQDENIRLKNENSQLKTAKSQTEQEIKKTSEEKALLAQREGREASEMRKIRDELVEAKKAGDLQARKSQELQQETAALRAQVLEYEQPVIRIGKDQYSLSRIINDAKLAAQVKQKIKAAPAPWSGKSAIDTVIAEETLYRKAREAGTRENKAEQDTLAQKHGLDAKEREYLAKYLVIDSLYKKKSAEITVPEKDVRAYYEKNREEFAVSPAGKTVRTLAVGYTGADELEKGLAAVELHREAIGGRKLEEIAKKHRDVASFREVPFETIPEWVREKLQQLRDGEVSTIISSDREFMIMQIESRQPAYHAYKDVRSGIEKKLAPDQEKRRQIMEQWLNDIAGEAEIIR